ncbi:MAG: FAD-dependent oxidoreductase, partial [Eubacteriales bacterium]|nr:FAD-dependent oxidoreductase [Eubacteriales bacterium]
VKFYNSMVKVNRDLETKIKGLYVLGDGSGVTHSLSQASASGIHVARILADQYA